MRVPFPLAVAVLAVGVPGYALAQPAPPAPDLPLVIQSYLNMVGEMTQQRAFFDAQQAATIAELRKENGNLKTALAEATKARTAPAPAAAPPSAAAPVPAAAATPAPAPASEAPKPP